MAKCDTSYWEKIGADKAHKGNFIGRGAEISIVDACVYTKSKFLNENNINQFTKCTPTVKIEQRDGKLQYEANSLHEFYHGTQVTGIVAARNLEKIFPNGINIPCGIAPLATINVFNKMVQQTCCFYSPPIINPKTTSSGKPLFVPKKPATLNIINYSQGLELDHEINVKEAIVKLCTTNGLMIAAVNPPIVELGSIGNPVVELTIPDTCTYNPIIRVGALDHTLQNISSSYGQLVDILAPGSNLVTVVPKEPDLKEAGIFPPKEDPYVAKIDSGTSLSAPIVSGLATIIQGYNPLSTAQEIRDIILKCSKETPSLYTFACKGRVVDIGNVINFLQGNTDACTTSTESCITSQQEISCHSTMPSFDDSADQITGVCSAMALFDTENNLCPAH